MRRSPVPGATGNANPAPRHRVEQSGQATGQPALIRIPLRNRAGNVVAFALIDEVDAAQASHRWSLNNGYASRTDVSGERKQFVLLHRSILGLAAGDRMQGDHINRDRLDNRRSNLRVLTPAQNSQNRQVRTTSRSSFRGVTWEPGRGWRARVRRDGKNRHLGYFDTEEAAGAVAAQYRRQWMPHSAEECP